MVAGGPGGPSMNGVDVTPVPAPRRGPQTALLALVVLLLVLCATGGVAVWRTHQDRSRAAADEERYGDVLAAATTEAEAFVNIRYDDAQASIDAVAAGATGDFKDQYASSTDGFVEVVKQERSVMTGEVVWAGVSDIDADSATVVVATDGTVTNRQTGGEPDARHFRLRLDLVLQDGRWLTDDLQFVG